MSGFDRACPSGNTMIDVPLSRCDYGDDLISVVCDECGYLFHDEIGHKTGNCPKCNKPIKSEEL